MRQTNARHIAYDILKNITSKGQYSNLALKKRLKFDVSKQDRAFVTQLVYGTLEHLLTIDYIISLYAKKNVKPAIKDILRLGIFQIYYLDVPDSAACNESVKLAKEIGKEGTSSFINAVLRNVSRDKEKIIWPDRKDTVRYLSVIYSYPMHIIKLLINDYGAELTEKIISFVPKNELVIRANTIRISSDELMNLLLSKGIESTKSNLAKDAIITNDSSIVDSEMYDKGLFSVQSESSMLAAQAACEAANRFQSPRILDACAAPGGKTFYIKEHIKNANITAWDVHEHRVKLIEAGIKRLGLIGITAEEQDATELVEEYLGSFDVVLIDAPCSGLGVIASKPDIKYSMSEADLAEIEELQKNILGTCSKYLKPNGVLIYSTCTILKNENERMANHFLENNSDFKKIEISELIDIDKINIENGYAQLLNINTGHDGFFIAGMVKQT